MKLRVSKIKQKVKYFNVQQVLFEMRSTNFNCHLPAIRRDSTRCGSPKATRIDNSYCI